MLRIRLDSIAFDAGTQVRAAIDPQVVSDYAEAMTSGDTFPPIVLFHDGNQHYLADGFHRFMAAQRNTFVDIDADIRPGTREDAVWFALGANRENGKRLSEVDKSHAVSMALRLWPERSHTSIAVHVGCSTSLVSKVSSKFTSESGIPVLTGRALQNRYKRERVQALIAKGGLDRRRVAADADVSVAFVSKVRAEMGLSDYERTREGRVRRRTRMQQMADDGYSSRQIASELSMSEEHCRTVLRDANITVRADTVTGHTRHHDSNRIIERIVMDAENLMEGTSLIDFADIDHGQFGEWIDSLIASRRALDTFIKRLIQEKKRHGEAA